MFRGDRDDKSLLGLAAQIQRDRDKVGQRLAGPGRRLDQHRLLLVDGLIES